MHAYLDNAASTPLANEVFEAMEPYLSLYFGNPSSLHSYGRKARAAIESSRKTIAQLLGASPGEIVFTSGGTEANNTFLRSISKAFGQLITSNIEHHSVLEVANQLEKNGVNVIFLDVDASGIPDYEQLEDLLIKNPSAVSLMYANNETGAIIDVSKVSKLCNNYESYFHTDAVQVVGHLPLDLSTSGIHGLSASAHKFHGPKGTGFMYVKNEQRIRPLILGGPQERELRAGTENVAGIVGLSRALELLHEKMEEDITYVQGLKDRFKKQIKSLKNDVYYNGVAENGLYTILNISLPESSKNEMLLFNLDLKGIAASGGSACSSGAVKESHVLKYMGVDPKRGALRFSFSRYNTPDEIDYAVKSLEGLLSD